MNTDMSIENHMRELMEQFRAEQPAKPTDIDVYSTVVGGVDYAAAHNEAQLKLEEYYLQFLIQMAGVFQERRGRLPSTVQELLADPVCKKMEDARIKRDTEKILEALKQLKP
jgi:hypothetical protein